MRLIALCLCVSAALLSGCAGRSGSAPLPPDPPDNSRAAIEMDPASEVRVDSRSLLVVAEWGINRTPPTRAGYVFSFPLPQTVTISGGESMINFSGSNQTCGIGAVDVSVVGSQPNGQGAALAIYTIKENTAEPRSYVMQHDYGVEGVTLSAVHIYIYSDLCNDRPRNLRLRMRLTRLPR